MTSFSKRAIAAIWNKSAFESTQVEDTLTQLGIKQAPSNAEIRLSVPDKAENGAIVQVEILSLVPNTESIAIIVDKNPTPLIAQFTFKNSADPYVVTRIKMAETSNVRALIYANGHYYQSQKSVEVLENGCG